LSAGRPGAQIVGYGHGNGLCGLGCAGVLAGACVCEIDDDDSLPAYEQTRGVGAF